MSAKQCKVKLPSGQCTHTTTKASGDCGRHDSSSRSSKIAERPNAVDGWVEWDTGVAVADNDIQPIPMNRVSTLLGKSVGRGNICSPDAPIMVERSETGTIYTLLYQPKAEESDVAKFFKKVRCLIRVHDISSESTGYPETRFTTLGDFKRNMGGGLDAVIEGGDTEQDGTNDVRKFTHPEDEHSVWGTKAPLLKEFAESADALASAGTGDRPVLRMAHIVGGGDFKGQIVVTDSYRLAKIRPPAKVSLPTGANIPVQPVQKFLDMAKQMKLGEEPIEISVGDYKHFSNNHGERSAPTTTTISCGEVAVQTTVNDDFIADPDSFPRFQSFYAKEIDKERVFEVPDPQKLAKWLVKNTKKSADVDNLAVLSTGTPATVQMMEKSWTPSRGYRRKKGAKNDGAVTSKETKWTKTVDSGESIGFEPSRLADALRHAGKKGAVSVSMGHTADGVVTPLMPVVITDRTPEPDVEILVMPTRI